MKKYEIGMLMNGRIKEGSRVRVHVIGGKTFDGWIVDDRPDSFVFEDKFGKVYVIYKHSIRYIEVALDGEENKEHS